MVLNSGTQYTISRKSSGKGEKEFLNTIFRLAIGVKRLFVENYRLENVSQCTPQPTYMPHFNFLNILVSYVFLAFKERKK